MTIVARTLSLLAVVVPCACSGNTSAPAISKPLPATSTTAVSTPCDLARDQRDSVEGLLAEGRLHRALLVIREANDDCEAEADRTWVAEVSTLAELGMWKDVDTLAGRIEARGDSSAKVAAARARDRANRYGVPLDNTPETKAPAHEAYRQAQKAQHEGKWGDAHASYLKAWELWRPNGLALMQAGLMAKQLGRNVEARRLFDRAIVELEQVTGKQVALDPAEGFAGGVSAVAWRDGLIAVAHGPFVSLVNQGTMRPMLRKDTRSNVEFIAISPDSTTIASGSWGNTVQIWDAQTGLHVREIQNVIELKPNDSGPKSTPTDLFASIAFSPDGTTLAAGGLMGSVRIWDLRSGQSSAILTGHSGAIRSITYSPDGARVVSGSHDGTVRVWDARVPRQIAKLDGHSGGVWSVAYSPNGKQFASGSYDTTVRVWNAHAPRQFVTLEGHSGAVTSVAFSPDATKLASGSFDGTARIWDVLNNRHIATLERHSGGVTSLAWSPDGSILLVATIDGAARIWNPRTGGQVASLAGVPERVRAVGVSPDATKLVSGSDDGSVRIWDLRAGRLVASDIRGHLDSVNFVAVSRDGQQIASGSNDKTVRIWDVPRLQRIPGAIGHTEGVRSVTYSPDGTKLATGSDTVRIWNRASGQLIRTLDGHSSRVTALAFSPDGLKLASGSNDNAVLIWDVHTGQLATTLENTIQFLEVRSGQIAPSPQEKPRLVKSLAWSPDGAHLASGNFDGDVRIWHVRSGRVIRQLEGHSGAVNSVGYSPDGTKLASGYSDATMRVWNVRSGQKVAVLEGHSGAVNSVCFFPDGMNLASGSEDGNIILWRTSDWTQLATLRAIRNASAGMVFTPDGYVDFVGDDADIARRAPLCRIDRFSFPSESCMERFEAPGLLAKALAGETSYRDP